LKFWGDRRMRSWLFLLTGTKVDVSPGVENRPRFDLPLNAARHREFDVMVVWRLDRRGQLTPALAMTLCEFAAIQVGFVSLAGALDLTTPSGRAMTGMLAVFAEFEREILRERVRAGTA
jgi:putative DNA-invertase from lambdoid prophage Rac